MNEKVQQFLTDLFLTNELNRLPEQFGADRIFDPPLIGVSRGDDPIFNKFKEVVAPEHLTPLEMWTADGLSETGGHGRPSAYSLDHLSLREADTG